MGNLDDHWRLGADQGWDPKTNLAIAEAGINTMKICKATDKSHKDDFTGG